MTKDRRETPSTVSPRADLRPRSPAEALEPGRAPSRPRGVKVQRERKALSGFVRLFSGLLTLGLVVMIAAGGAVGLLHHHFEQHGPLTEPRTVAIPKGDGVIDIADRLAKEGVISSAWAFVSNYKLRAMAGTKMPPLKHGEYVFKPGESMREVLDELGEGKSIQYKVTVPEGLTSQQIVERLKADNNLTGEIVQVPAEGTLLPDTYRFSKGMARQELIDRMQVEHQKLVAGLWEKRQADLPVQTPEQALILASIIEKETGRSDERERVAAVFVNRLRKPMRLQSDPTIVYGLVGGQGPLGRGITRSDIDSKTAYNTYQIDGLPPGPICNPGRSAIEATLNPAKTSDLFFVADGSGGHVFTTNLKDHNAAVQNWRKFERDQKAKQQGAVAPVQAPAAETMPVAVTNAPAAGKASPAAAKAQPAATKASTEAPPAAKKAKKAAEPKPSG